MRKMFVFSFLFASLICFSQNDKAHTITKAITTADSASSANPLQMPSSADSITLKTFDGTAVTNCIRPCGLARRYYNSVDSTGKPLSARCYTTYPVLYVLNGLALVNNNLPGNDGVRICLNDIQSIGILKPAEGEALYGIMGKGGVVLVTTKCIPQGKDL